MRYLTSALGALLIAAIAVSAPPGAAPVADAARAGDLDRVRTLLADGEDANAAHGDGMSALHWAAERGDAGLVEVLLEGGAKVDAATRIGSHTPLHVAASAGRARVVTMLLEAGASATTAVTTSGATPLHLAADAGSVESIDALVAHGADVNAKEKTWGQTPLILAAARNRVSAIEALLRHGADPNATSDAVDLTSDYELSEAAKGRQRAILEAFSEGGARPDSAQVQTAVFAARDLYLSGEVPEKKGDDNDPFARFRRPQLKSKGGLTALLHASRQGFQGAANALLDGDADVNQASSGDGTTPLLMASVNGQFDLAMALLERGADPNVASEENGVTPLWAAVNAEWQPRTRYPQPQEHDRQETSYLELMRALLDAGADPNHRISKHPWYMVYSGCGNSNCGLVDTAGATAFWRAAYATDVPAMSLLAEYGADPNIPTTAPEPRRRRRGTTAVNDPERGALAVLPAAPGLWIPTDLTTMGPDPSGLPPYKAGDPGVYPIHAASGVGYGEGFAGNAHRHVPDAWLSSVQYLIELGADVNQRDFNGYNALHHAAARGDNEMIHFLVEQGGDVTAVSRRGQTTADMANGPVQRVSPIPETVALLESLGSKNNNNCVSC